MRLVFACVVLLCSQALVGEVSGFPPTLEVPKLPTRPVTLDGVTGTSSAGLQKFNAKPSNEEEIAKLGSNPHPQFGTVPGTGITQPNLESKSPLELLLESAHKQSQALKANTEPTLNTKDQSIKQSPDSLTGSSGSSLSDESAGKPLLRQGAEHNVDLVHPVSKDKQTTLPTEKQNSNPNSDENPKAVTPNAVSRRSYISSEAQNAFAEKSATKFTKLRPTPKELSQSVTGSSKAKLPQLSLRKIGYVGMGLVLAGGTVGVLGAAGVFDKSGSSTLS